MLGSTTLTHTKRLQVARAHGVRCYVALPDDAAEEKAQLLEVLGADVDRVRMLTVSYNT